METFLQAIILLLLVILLVDRFYNKTIYREPEKKAPKPKKKPSVMGESKVLLKEIKTKENPKPPLEAITKKRDDKASSTDVLETIFNPPKTKTIIADQWELAEEEEALKADFSAKTDQDFATGLSFEELQKIAPLLEQEELTSETLPVAIKIADTELLEVINKQIPEAEQRVSELLNKHLAIYNQPKINEDWRDFDIGEFV